MILFDFDFTLGDSSKAILECFRYAIESQRLPVPDDEAILSTVGMSLPDSFAILAPEGCFKTMRERFIERGDEVALLCSTVYEDVPAVMSALRSSGYKTGIVTSKFRRRIEAILDRDGLSHLFDVVVGAEDIPNHKPNPDGIRMAMRRLGVAAEDTTYVGDALVDMKTAQSAGVRFIGVLTGPTPDGEWARHGVPVVGSLTGLLAFFPALEEEQCHV